MLMRAIPDDEDPRVDQRSHVFLMAVLSTGVKSYPVRVRNLSVHGALLEGSQLPREHQTVSLKRGSLAMTGQIAWVTDEHCGIRFSEAINVHEWVDRAGPVGQQRIDSAVADFRNNAVSKTISGAGRPEQDSLVDMSERLLRACERISELPGMSIQLAEEVLKVEATAHALGALARRT